MALTRKYEMSIFFRIYNLNDKVKSIIKLTQLISIIAPQERR